MREEDAENMEALDGLLRVYTLKVRLLTMSHPPPPTPSDGTPAATNNKRHVQKRSADRLRVHRARVRRALWTRLCGW